MLDSLRRSRGLLVAVLVVAVVIVGAAVVVATTDASLSPFGLGPGTHEQLAPGVSHNGTVNVTRLLAAHRSRLYERGFNSTIVVLSRSNGSVAVASGQRMTATPNLTRVLTQQNRSVPGGQNTTATTYANESATDVRLAVGGNETYRVGTRTQTPTVPPISRATVSVLREAADTFTVANVTESGGQRRVTLTATTTRSINETGVWTTVRMVVTGQGVIRSLHIHSGTDGGRQVLAYRYSLGKLGVDSVARPEWVGSIPSNATEVTPGQRSQGR
ncbi:MAG: hypothetical protein ABEI77_06175 [Halorientalis sp.]